MKRKIDRVKFDVTEISTLTFIAFTYGCRSSIGSSMFLPERLAVLPSNLMDKTSRRES